MAAPRGLPSKRRGRCPKSWAARRRGQGGEGEAAKDRMRAAAPQPAASVQATGRGVARQLRKLHASCPLQPEIFGRDGGMGTNGPVRVFLSYPTSAARTARRSRLARKPIPTFASDEATERFVATVDLADHDLSGTVPVRFEVEKKDARMNIHLPASLLAALEERAERRGIPYQRLVRAALEEAVEPEASVDCASAQR